MTDLVQADPSASEDPMPPVLEAPEVQRAIRYAPLSELYLEYKFWANPRSQTGLDDADIKDLGASILASTTNTGENDATAKIFAGVRVPLEVVMIRVNDGFINLVIDGQRRHLAVTAAGLPEETLLPVFDLEPEPVVWTRELADFYLLRALETVGTRAGLSSFELSESAQRLRTSKDKETGKDFTLAKISRAIGRSESWVSKILSAREHASAKLLHSWRTGEITDEQFKDLAAVRDQGKQREEAAKVVEARQAGDKTGARTHAKEQKIEARAAEPPRPVKSPPAKSDRPAKAGATPKADGGSKTLPSAPAERARKPPSFAVVEDFLSFATRKPPTHDYVKGLMDGARWVAGLMDAGAFGKPWLAYMRHVLGTKPKPSKAAPRAPKGKANGKARRRR